MINIRALIGNLPNRFFRQTSAGKRKLLLVAYLLLLVCGLSACRGQGDDAAAMKVVETMYTALSNNDMDAYLDTLTPESRRQPNPLGLLNAISIGSNLGGVNLGIDLSQLMRVSVRDLQLAVVQHSGNYTLIRAQGNMRYSLLMMELPFCEDIDVRRVGSSWYVDMLAPERRPRLERVIQRQQEELERLTGAIPAETGNLDTDLQNMFRAFGLGMERALDLCDR